MDNRIAKVIGENIRKRIDEKGLLMREVAAEVNVLEHTFFQMDAGRKTAVGLCAVQAGQIFRLYHGRPDERSGREWMKF